MVEEVLIIICSFACRLCSMPFSVSKEITSTTSEVSFSSCLGADETRNVCTLPNDSLKSRCPQPGTNKQRILVFDKFLAV